MEALQAPGSTASEPSPYKPIDPGGREIRLVELSPGGYDDPISLSLHIVKLEKRVTQEEESDEDESQEDESDEAESDEDEFVDWQPPFCCQFTYEALSYAWGTAISPRKALVDGFKLPITKSLHQGLRRLRLDDKPRMLWVDALCINQRDIEERSRQVQRMAVIYRSAENVLIWLGEWPSNAECSHSDYCQALWLTNYLYHDKEPSRSQTLHHMCEHLVDILELPWFRRLWVIQELALAIKDPVVLIGSMSTTWSSLWVAVHNTRRFRGKERLGDHQPSNRFMQGYSRVSALEKIRSRSDSHRGLYWCLIASQSAMSADPRDKVYGLLGLCNSQFTEEIAVDYSKFLRHALAKATVISILEECAFPYLVACTKPTGLFDRIYWTGSSWLLDFTSIPTPACVDTACNSEKVLRKREERRDSIRLPMDHQTLYAYVRYVGMVCETQNCSWLWLHYDTGFRDQRSNTEI